MTEHKNMTPVQRANKSNSQRRRWKSEKYRYFEKVLSKLKFTHRGQA